MELASKLKLEVVTPERMVLSEPVDSVTYKAWNGYVGILPGHVPMLTTLQIGVVEYRQGSAAHKLAVSGGFVEVLPDRVILLADTAEKADEIDRERALATKADAESKLQENGSVDHFQIHRARVEKAVARLSVSRHS